MRIRVVVLAMMIGMVVVGCAENPTQETTLPPQTPIHEATLPPQTQISDRIATNDARALVTLNARGTADSLTAAVPTLTPTVTETPVPTPTPLPYSLLVDARPDMVIYRKNDRVCSVSGESAPFFIVEAEGSRDFQLSSDKQFVTFTKRHTTNTGGVEIIWEQAWVARTDGSGVNMMVDLAEFPAIESQLNLPPGGYMVHFADLQWIPQTHLVAFTTSLYDTTVYIARDTDQYSNDLHVFSADTGAVQTLLEPGNGGSFFAPSPDGRAIAFIRRGEYIIEQGIQGIVVVTKQDNISLISTDGASRQQDMLLYDGAVVSYNDGYLYLDPQLVWSPDSSGVHVAIFPTNPQTDDFKAEIEGWFLPINGAAAARYHLTDLNYAATGVSAMFPSSDGHYVAFRAVYQNVGGLHIVDTLTQHDAVYFQDNYVRFIRWEPDSWHFIVEVQKANNIVEIVRGDVAGLSFEPVEEKPVLDLKDCAP